MDNSKKTTIELSIIGGMLVLLFFLVVFIVIPKLVPKTVKIKVPAKKSVEMNRLPSTILREHTFTPLPALPLELAQKDPFKPQLFKKSTDALVLSDLKVNGISIVGENKFAIINDNINKEGDIINGARIEKIEQNEIVLSRDGKEYILKIKGD